jgi:hypothetical protein
MMITKTMMPPTIHIQGCTVTPEDEVVVVVVVEETALSCAKVIPVKNTIKAKAKNDR